jgi:hypothetical protein
MSNMLSALDGWMVFSGQAAWTSTGMNAYMANTIEGGHSITSSCVGKWHHIAVTYKGKDVTAYYDGKLATDHVYQGRGFESPYNSCRLSVDSEQVQPAR